MLSKFDVPTDSVNVEASHWLNIPETKVILKLRTRKNSGKIHWSRKKLKEDDLKSIEKIARFTKTIALFTEMIVCVSIRRDSGLNVKILSFNLILGYWISNDSLKITVSERFPAKTINHMTDLEKLFPGNLLLEDASEES